MSNEYLIMVTTFLRASVMAYLDPQKQEIARAQAAFCVARSELAFNFFDFGNDDISRMSRSQDKSIYYMGKEIEITIPPASEHGSGSAESFRSINHWYDGCYFDDLQGY